MAKKVTKKKANKPELSRIKFKYGYDYDGIYFELEEAETTVQYAFVSRDGEQCHKFVRCRDYLQEILWGNVKKHHTSKYNVKHHIGKNPPVDYSKCRIAIRINAFGKKNAIKKAKGALKVLNSIEEYIGFSLSKMAYCGVYKEKYCFLFLGSRSWMYALPIFSLYTLAIRLGVQYVANHHKYPSSWKVAFKNQNDWSGEVNNKYQASKGEKMVELLRKLDKKEIFSNRKIKNYPDRKEVPTNKVHETSGVVSFVTGMVDKRISKRWNMKKYDPKA